MKQSIRKGLTYCIIGFFALFILRLIYGFVAYPNGTIDTNNSYVPQFEFSKRNYASTKMKRQVANNTITTPVTVDQKYEKIGTLGAVTNEFKEDEKQTRNLIKKHNALIQFEKSAGLVGNQYLHLAIGVAPEKFDEFIARLKDIGKLVSLDINKTDKTSEYKDLQAKQTSLEKTRNNLLAIKNKSGQVSELVELETKILDIENQIQDLGISLGAFNEENEFCTVKFTLQESKTAERDISIASRLKTAFEWTVQYYFYLLILLLLAAGVSLITASLIKVATPMVNKFWKE